MSQIPKGCKVIKDSKSVYAIIIPSSVKVEDINFITDSNSSLQVGVSQYKEKDEVKAHKHPSWPRKIVETQEVLFVRQGEIQVSVYNEKGQDISNPKLSSGDVIYFVSGGHRLNPLSNTQIIEVKQGPYQGKNTDKKFLKEAENDSGI